MQLIKTECEEATAKAIKMAKLCILTMAKAGCLVPELYEFVEETAAKLDAHREALGLASVAPKEFANKFFSTTVKTLKEKGISGLQESGIIPEGVMPMALTEEQGEQLAALLESFAKSNTPNGMDFRNMTYDPKKAN